MIDDYSPLLSKYQELWATYGDGKVKCLDTLPVPIIISQDDAVRWSLKLRELFAAKAGEIGYSADVVRRVFMVANATVDKLPKEAATRLFSVLSLCYSALGRQNYDIEAAADIEKFGLFFDYSLADDLFLSDESDINSVMSFE